MKDPLIEKLQALTQALTLMATEQRETNRLVRELLELEAGELSQEGTEVPETQSMGTSVGSIVRRG